MGSHPLNLGLRFVLELGALGALGYFGWTREDDALRWVLALGLPILAATAWGVFAVPDDPSRSGKTVVVTPGPIRLLIELSVFGSGVAALFFAEAPWSSLAFGLLVAAHYVASYDRVAWLFEQRRGR